MSDQIRTKPDEARDRICHVAEALFRRLGYLKTTVADIAQALGMSSANVYRFYPSKNAINDAICRRILSDMQVELQAFTMEPATASSRVEAMVMAMHRHHKAQFTHEKRVFDMVMAAMEENWGAIEEHIRTCTTSFATVIAQGIAAGEFAPGDPAELAEMVMKSCVFAFHPVLIAECADKDTHVLVQRLARFALRALTLKVE